MGKKSRLRLIGVAFGLYCLIVMMTDMTKPKGRGRQVFRIDKLSLREGEDVKMVEFLRRRIRVKDVCAAWGAYTTKSKFLRRPSPVDSERPTTGIGPSGITGTGSIERDNNTSKEAPTASSTTYDLTKDRRELSQAQLERIWQLSKRSSLHQMFVDRSHGLMWCKVPKAASTSWLHAYLQIAGITDYSHTDVAGKHALLREKFPLLHTALQKKFIPIMMKFMVVRDPFERVLSAYRDKLENSERDLKDRGGYYYAIYGKKIVQAYRKTARGNRRRINPKSKKEPTFREFVQYLLDTDVESYDEHWRPIFLLCTPCHIKFDVVTKMETLNADTEFVLYHRGLSDTVKIEWSHKTDSTQKTADVVKDYFSQLTPSEVKQLYHKYLLDFLMFEYNVEPYYAIAEAALNHSLSENSIIQDGDQDDNDNDDNDDDDNDNDDDDYEDDYEEDDDDGNEENGNEQQMEEEGGEEEEIEGENEETENDKTEYGANDGEEETLDESDNET